jgi:hypothetical protein
MVPLGYIQLEHGPPWLDVLQYEADELSNRGREKFPTEHLLGQIEAGHDRRMVIGIEKGNTIGIKKGNAVAQPPVRYG